MRMVFRECVSPLDDTEQLLQKLLGLCFTYQHISCLYEPSTIDSVESFFQTKGRVSDIVQNAHVFIQKQVESLASQEKNSCRGNSESTSEHIPSQETKSKQTRDHWIILCRKKEASYGDEIQNEVDEEKCFPGDFCTDACN